MDKLVYKVKDVKTGRYMEGHGGSLSFVENGGEIYSSISSAQRAVTLRWRSHFRWSMPDDSSIVAEEYRLVATDNDFHMNIPGGDSDA